MAKKRAVVLVNAMNLKSGGGLTLLKLLCRSNLSIYKEKIVVILDKNTKLDLAHSEKKYPPSWMLNPYLFILRDIVILTWYLIKFRGVYLINFSDIPYPFGFVKQTYYFDWPYLGLSFRKIRSFGLSYTQILERLIKAQCIKLFMNKTSTTIAVQSKVALKAIQEKWPGAKTVCPSASFGYISEDIISGTNGLASYKLNRKFNEKEVQILCPSTNHPHKNLGILNNIELYLPPRSLCRLNLRITCSNDSRYKRPVEIIEYLGYLSQEELVQYYAACDYILLPSMIETLGLTYIEALYFKKPLIVADIAIAREICRDAAIYFNPLSPQSLAQAIEKCLEPEVFSILKTNAQRIHQRLANSSNPLQMILDISLNEAK